KSLFGRSILLLVVPMVLLQLVAAFAFYQRRWDTISRRLSGGIAGEIAAVLELYTAAPTPADQQAVFDMARRQFQMAMEFNPGAKLSEEAQKLRPLSITDRELKRALDDRVGLPYVFDADRQDDQVEIQLQLRDGVLTIWT